MEEVNYSCSFFRRHSKEADKLKFLKLFLINACMLKKYVQFEMFISYNEDILIQKNQFFFFK